MALRESADTISDLERENQKLRNVRPRDKCIIPYCTKSSNLRKMLIIWMICAIYFQVLKTVFPQVEMNAETPSKIDLYRIETKDSSSSRIPEVSLTVSYKLLLILTAVYRKCHQRLINLKMHIKNARTLLRSFIWHGSKSTRLIKYIIFSNP